MSSYLNLCIFPCGDVNPPVALVTPQAVRQSFSPSILTAHLIIQGRLCNFLTQVGHIYTASGAVRKYQSSGHVYLRKWQQYLKNSYVKIQASFYCGCHLWIELWMSKDQNYSINSYFWPENVYYLIGLVRNLPLLLSGTKTFLEFFLWKD